MSGTAFNDCRVSLEGRTLKVQCEIVNRSAESWLPDDGWGAGYHLFDEPTGTLVVDGERTPVALARSDSRMVSMEIALPPEPGNYNIYVSLMREHVAWFYDQGWPFLLIDVAVDDTGEPGLIGWRVADKRAVARRRSQPR